ncbi:hypothetical protein M3O57_19925, partial [Xanthomonas nasturtii]|uniref:hypothetical protein n=1 Tax=Xanthomonas nasturtii TaxID=1843581 RepID=UPI002011D891
GILEPGAPVAADLWCLKGIFQGRLSRQFAAPLADSILECFAGERPYFSARQRILQIEEMESDLSAGVPVADVAAKYGLSRAGLYRLFPGGVKARSKKVVS